MSKEPQFWPRAAVTMALLGIGTPVVVLIIERDVVFALVTIPLGIFCGLLAHWWAWRVGGPGDPTRKR